MTSQPRLTRIERGIRAADASSCSGERPAAMRMFLRKLNQNKYWRNPRWRRQAAALAKGEPS